MSLKNVLISHTAEYLETTKFYLQSTLSYTISEEFICKDATEIKATLKKLETCIVYITHCHTYPWTIQNLSFLLNLFKKKKVQVFFLDIKVMMCVDIYGKPAADYLSYLQLMSQYNRKLNKVDAD